MKSGEKSPRKTGRKIEKTGTEKTGLARIKRTGQEMIRTGSATAIVRRVTEIARAGTARLIVKEQMSNV